MCIGPSLGSYFLKQSGNKFLNIWHSICSACGYCIFVYSVLGQVCWPWMTLYTAGSVVHVQYGVSWKNVLEILESSEKILELFLNKRVGTLNVVHKNMLRL